MKFCYFARVPFTTKSAIKAHEYAFRFFCGRPQTILYDQDRVFFVSDNFGDFILVSKFEEYVKEVGFQARFCHKHAPDSKGKIENTVNYVKTGFLKGKTTIYPKVIENTYGNDENVKHFIERLNEIQPDYFVKAMRRLVRMLKFYTKD